MVDQFIHPIPEVWLENTQTAEWCRSLTLWLDDISRPDGVLDTAQATTVTVGEQGSELEVLADAINTVSAQSTATTNALAELQNSLPAYSISNDGTVRTLDADAAAGSISVSPTQAQVENIRDAVLAQADVLATVIRDLKNKGVLGV